MRCRDQQSWAYRVSALGPNTQTNRQAKGGWGGGLELAAFSALKNANVEVYEKGQSGGYKRISNFGDASKVVSVIYSGRCHYDALVV